LGRQEKSVTDSSAENSDLTAARRRVQEAAEKFDRQQRRYAKLAIEADAAAATAKALLQELETELEISREALSKLEEQKREP
jgi:hypothetical protein